jgi:hypothetical protein
VIGHPVANDSDDALRVKAAIAVKRIGPLLTERAASQRLVGDHEPSPAHGHMATNTGMIRCGRANCRSKASV